MAYIKRIVTADITRQIGLTKKVSKSFFRFDPDMEFERDLFFYSCNGLYYNGTIKQTGHSITITGEISTYIRDCCNYNDILVLKKMHKPNAYKFLVAKKGSDFYNECNSLLNTYGDVSNAIYSTTHLIINNTEIENRFL